MINRNPEGVTHYALLAVCRPFGVSFYRSMVTKCMESPNLFLIIRIKSPNFPCQYCMESPNLVVSMYQPNKVDSRVVVVLWVPMRDGNPQKLLYSWNQIHKCLNFCGFAFIAWTVWYISIRLWKHYELRGVFCTQVIYVFMSCHINPFFTLLLFYFCPYWNYCVILQPEK